MLANWNWWVASFRPPNQVIAIRRLIHKATAEIHRKDPIPHFYCIFENPIYLRKRIEGFARTAIHRTESTAARGYWRSRTLPPLGSTAAGILGGSGASRARWISGNCCPRIPPRVPAVHPEAKARMTSPLSAMPGAFAGFWQCGGYRWIFSWFACDTQGDDEWERKYFPFVFGFNEADPLIQLIYEIVLYI